MVIFQEQMDYFTMDPILSQLNLYGIPPFDLN